MLMVLYGSQRLLRHSRANPRLDEPLQGEENDFYASLDLLNHRTGLPCRS